MNSNQIRKMANKIAGSSNMILTSIKNKFKEFEDITSQSELVDYLVKGTGTRNSMHVPGGIEYNIKIRNIGIPGKVRDLADDKKIDLIFWQTANDYLSSIGQTIKSEFDWVNEWSQEGRSGGWLALSLNIDTSNLEDIRDFINAFEKAVNSDSDLTSFINDSKNTLKDINSIKNKFIQIKKDISAIELLIKNTIKDFVKSIEDFKWWKQELS